MSACHTWRKRFTTLSRDHSGIAAVEVGITLLPFLLVMFGTAEFGWYFLETHTMNSAVSQGIRIGATGAVLNDAAGNPMTRENSIKQAIIDRAAGVMVIDPADIKIFQPNADWTDPNNPAVVNTASAGGQGAFRRVRVNYQHQFFTDLVGGFFGGGSGSFQLTSEATYRNENFIVGGS